jgi:hypothetical protein
MSPFSPAGFIVSWHVPSIVKLADLRAGITAAGCDAMEYAPDLKAQSIVSRSAGKIARELSGKNTRRLARKVDGTKRQITAEFVGSTDLTYQRDAALDFDKSTGKLVSAELTGLDSVQDEITETRKAGDVTRAVQRIVSDHASDLIPVRKEGGAYFIPAGHAVIDKVRTVLEAVGGEMMQFACTIGHGVDADRTGQSVASVITDYMLKQIEELQEAVKELGEKNIRSDVKRARLTRVAELKDRVAAYASLVGTQHSVLEKALTRAEEELMAKLTAKHEPEPEVDPKDAAFAESVAEPEMVPRFPDGVLIPNT